MIIGYLCIFFRILNKIERNSSVGGSILMRVVCPECKEMIQIKDNGHGRCKCGAHVKVLKRR